MRPRRLTDEQVARIRAIVAARKALPTLEQLASEMGLSRTAIENIVAGRCYRDVPRGMLQITQIDELKELA